MVGDDIERSSYSSTASPVSALGYIRYLKAKNNPDKKIQCTKEYLVPFVPWLKLWVFWAPFL
ncbi:MAG: hypothetical protein ACP5KV_00600 [Candidatus Methanomethylicaceae archaeon]